ncbi:MAG: RelA/SpoT family protein [Helicobacter sp.]|nr:RelA/SpoT family protein [Helicobacter sp.]
MLAHQESDLFQELVKIRTLDAALNKLYSIITPSNRIKRAVDIAIEYHAGQKRKSGEDYIVHPICVACIIAYYGGDSAMICAALLHDVVEDTEYSLDSVFQTFGSDVGNLVDALTKISEVRKEELNTKTSQKVVSTALSFRKMLIAAVKDSRALVIKISDRLHNMLTLDALPENKQKSISEETLVVYSPIAHRLGISSIKNELEDLGFYYLFNDKYQKIKDYLEHSSHSFATRFDLFIAKIKSLLLKNNFAEDEFLIEHRVKRPYSIHLKMQRKGVSIDEILDLLAIRIIVKSTVNCYKILGLIHCSFKPIISRFKDYIALPKENGYQTIHTTIFEQSWVYEVQIRTFDMHRSAQFGVAAHWKYKSGGLLPNMDWLNNFEYQNQSIEEFYELAKNDLYQEDIVVFSPDGDTYNLPLGSIVLDYAYAVHSEVGNHARDVYVNNKKASLLGRLRSGDIVQIITDSNTPPKYTWIDEVKTSKAKSCLRTQRKARLKDIEQKAAINMFAGFFNKEPKVFQRFLSINGFNIQSLWRVLHDPLYLSKTFEQVKNKFFMNKGFFVKMRFARFKLKAFKIDKFQLHSVQNISEVVFDCCCHPRHGDEILGIYYNQKVIIHHKLCDKLYEEIEAGAKILTPVWAQSEMPSFKVVVSLEDRRYGIERFLQTLSQNECNITGLNYEVYKNQFSPYYEVVFEVKPTQAKAVKEILHRNYKIIDFKNMKDAYLN